jgi:DNA-binding response OmpR family regulator/CRP-like cAMP-binding protein
MLQRNLELLGHTVVLAENGRQALEMLETGDFDLVLLDILMPEMDGFEVLGRLKSDPARRDLPVIVISALEEMESVVKGIKAGAEDYLPRPFDETLLHARIDACLEKKRLRDHEIEYLRHVTQLTDAAAAVQTHTFAQDQLASTAQRTDALGRLARVFQEMALEIYVREQEMQRAAAAREQALREQLERMQRDLADSQTAPTQVFEHIPPFDFLNATEKQWLAGRVQPLAFPTGWEIFAGKDDRDQLWLLLKGQIEIAREGGTEEQVQAPAYLNEGRVFLDHCGIEKVISKTDVRCFALHGEDVRNLVSSNAMFRQAFATVLRNKHRIFHGYEAFVNLLFARAEEGRLHLDELVAAYRGLNSVLHRGSTSQELDLDALAYVMPRLPGSITSVQTLHLAEELPQMLQGEEHHFDVASQRARKRKFYEVLSNKVVALLRDPMTDRVDLITKLCIYGVETRKIRERLLQANAGAALARYATWDGSRAERPNLAEILPFSSEQIERLNGIFGDLMPRRLYEIMAQAGQVSLYFQSSPSAHTATALEQWLARVRKGVAEVLGTHDPDEAVEVHIISSNTHSVHNCLSPWLHHHAGEIMQWARETNIPVTGMELPEDRLYQAARKWFSTHPEQAEKRTLEDRATGILRLADVSRTGIDVSLIHANRIQGPLDHALPEPNFSRQTLIVNIDYAYGQQAELIMRSLILLFGKRIRSISVFGKSGAVVGSRGDVLLPNQLLMQTDDQLYPVANQDLSPADFAASGYHRPVHTGTLLTVLGTVMQSREMLSYYRNFYGAIGMEMEGSFYLREVRRAMSLGLIDEDVQLRFAYYTSDTPLEERASLASNMPPAQGVPAVYAITRAVLRRIFAVGPHQIRGTNRRDAGRVS